MENKQQRLKLARQLLKEADNNPQSLSFNQNDTFEKSPKTASQSQAQSKAYSQESLSDDDIIKKQLTKLKNYALKKLALREYSVKEIKNKLIAYIDNWLLIDPEAQVRAASQPFQSRPSKARKNKLTKGSQAHHALLEKVDVLVQELTKQGYQSDVRTTKAVLRKTVNKGQGPRRLNYKLKQQGLGTESIDDDISSINWLKQAIQTRQKRFGVELPVEAKEKARQLRFLQYRGFHADTCYKAISTNLHDLD